MKIIAVVVTYNRLELLKRNIGCLRQNQPLSSIVVVNNGSTDGTAGWLSGQQGLTVITQENVGGSGGFYTGMQYAYREGADWIWCMDDDVFPRPDCLEHLLEYAEGKDIGILAPRRLLDGQIFTHDFLAYNLSNPFASMYRGRLSKMQVTEPGRGLRNGFRGTAYPSGCGGKSGVPTKNFSSSATIRIIAAFGACRVQDTLCAHGTDGQTAVLFK